MAESRYKGYTDSLHWVTPNQGSFTDCIRSLLPTQVQDCGRSMFKMKGCSQTLPSSLGESRAETTMESNKCVYCGKDFVNKYTKERHLVQQHGEAPQVKPEKSIPEVSILSSLRCRFCNRAFTTKPNRKRHEITMHDTDISNEPPVVPTAVICKECGEEEVLNFTSLKKYRKHLQQHHEIPTRKVDYEFSSTQGKCGGVIWR